MSGEEKQDAYIFFADLIGEYSFCFSNEMSTWTDKLADFEINMENEQSDQYQKTKDKDNPVKVTEFEESVARISSSATKIIRKQKYLRTRGNCNFTTVRKRR